MQMSDNDNAHDTEQMEQDAAENLRLSVMGESITPELPEAFQEAPEMAANELEYYASQMDSHEQENPFEFDYSIIAPPDPEPIKVDDSEEKVLEDWEELLLKARESKMSRISGGSFVINGLVQNRETGIMFGGSGSKKTFLAVHMACCVAAGVPCFGKGVRQGMTYYFAPEDATGVRERVRGWELAYNEGRPLPTMQVIPSAFDFTDREKADLFISSIEKLYAVLPPAKRKTSLIVIDTLSSNIATMSRNGKELDENSNNDAAYMLKKASELCQRLGCAMLFIHHSGKDEEKGSRGASALRANVGFEIAVRAIKGQTAVIIEPSKLKMASILPKRKVEFISQKLPAELLAERAAAKAELCPDEDSGWSVDEYDTTLVPRNHLQPVDIDTSAGDEELAKPGEMTQAQKVALQVRSNTNTHGISKQALVDLLVVTRTIEDRNRANRAIKAAVDKNYLVVTNTGNFKHHQQNVSDFASRFGITEKWTPPDE